MTTTSQQRYFASLSTEAINQLLDSELIALSKPWKGSIPFSVFILGEQDAISSALFQVTPQSIDIAEFLNGQQYPTRRLYFCPKAYPPPANIDDMAGSNALEYQGWKDLKRDLCISAHNAGNPILSNGSNGKNASRIFRCINHRNFKSNAQEVTTENPLRGASMTNNEKGNRRFEGKKDPRKIKTYDVSHLCSFHFTVKWDHLGFFVELHQRSGNHEHEHHAKPFHASISLPTRLLTEKQKKITRDVVDATCNIATGRNFLFRNIGRYFSTIKIAYLDRSGKKNNGTSDDIEMMLKNFEASSEIKFTTLSDVPVSELEDLSTADSTFSHLTISTTKEDDGKISNTRIDSNPFLAPITTAAKKNGPKKALEAAQYLFMSIAWIVLPAFRFLKLCPEVIWCDVTSHSNNKGFYLLTFSCRTSVDKHVVFLWIWIPNEQRISFRWVFQHAIPILIPKYIRDRVQFIMKDGDPQQRNEILLTLFNIFPNAKEGGCGWHIG